MNFIMMQCICSSIARNIMDNISITVKKEETKQTMNTNISF